MNKLGRSILLAMLVAVALYLLLAATYSDGKSVLAGLMAFSPAVLLLGLFCASLNYALRFFKWQYYLALLRIELPVFDSLLVFLSGFALTVTPGKIGEVLKSYLLRESHGVPVARTAPIVLAERLTDLISLLGLSLLGASAWMTAKQRYLVAIGFALCAALVVVVAWKRLAHLLLDLCDLLPPRRITQKVVPRLRTFYDSAHSLLGPGPLLLCVLLSTGAWFCECLAFYIIVRAVAHASLLLCTFIYSLMTVAGALAFVPGGLGVTEGGMAVLLTELGGVAKPEAVAATLIVRVLTLWFAVLLGLGALFLYRKRQSVNVDLAELKRRDDRP